MWRIFLKVNDAAKYFKFWLNASEAAFNKFLPGHEEMKLNL